MPNQSCRTNYCHVWPDILHTNNTSRVKFHLNCDVDQVCCSKQRNARRFWNVFLQLFDRTDYNLRHDLFSFQTWQVNRATCKCNSNLSCCWPAWVAETSSVNKITSSNTLSRSSKRDKKNWCLFPVLPWHMAKFQNQNRRPPHKTQRL